MEQDTQREYRNMLVSEEIMLEIIFEGRIREYSI